MGGKSSKDTQGLVPRDGTDEIEIQPKKLVTLEQFDELRHKFQLLEQLMQQDKGKLSDLETSVTEYQHDKQLLRKSFVEMDSEVRKDKDEREQLERNLAQQVEQQTREKYQLLDQMLNSQQERTNQLLREQEDRANKLQREYGELDQRLTSSLKVERGEYERLLESKMEEGKGQGKLEETVSRLLDQKVSPVPNFQQEIDARKRETEEVRESIRKEKQDLLAHIQKVQASLDNSKQLASTESKSELAEQLSSTKDEMVSRLKEEQLARGELETVMRTLLDNKVNEQQKALFERIKEKEDKIQQEIERMEQLKETMEEMKVGQKEVERKFSEVSTVYERRLADKEEEKRDLARKISQNFEHRLSEVQSSLTEDLTSKLSRAETIKEETDSEKNELQKQLQTLKEELDQKLTESQQESQTNTSESVQSLQTQLSSQIDQSDQRVAECENGLASALERITAAQSEVSDVRTQLREELSKISDEIDTKTEVMLEARLSDWTPQLNERLAKAEARCESLELQFEGANPGQLDSDQLDQIQKTGEHVSVLLDRIEQSQADVENVTLRMSEVEGRQAGNESQLDKREEQLASVQSELNILRTENKELRAKVEAPSPELTKLSEENARLRESVNSLMKSRDDQTAAFVSLRRGDSGQSNAEVPPESPIEKIEEMDSLIKKQGHGMNDMGFLIDESSELSKTTSERLDDAIEKFDLKFEDFQEILQRELEAVRAEMTKKLSGNSTANSEIGASNPFGDNFS